MDLARRIEGPEFAKHVAYSPVLWQVHIAGKLVGLAGCYVLDGDLHLSICLVAPEARGRNLQRRLVRVRLAYGRANGCRTAYTYANRRNHPSLIQLLREGFSPYAVRNGYCYVARYL